MSVIVVEPRAVAQDEIALDFLEGQFARAVLGIVMGLVGVLEEFRNAKAARVAVRLAEAAPLTGGLRFDLAEAESPAPKARRPAVIRQRSKRRR